MSTFQADRDGRLETLPIERAGDRAWNYVTLGLGQPAGAAFWADFVYTQRSVGYDGTLDIEHEDSLINSVEGVGRAARQAQAARPGRAPRLEAANI